MRKEYLICIDSDGCAMDTMNSKHEQCFGPALVQIWNLREEREKVQSCWNRINLFSQSRGINRFLALRMVLEELGYSRDMEGFSLFAEWTGNAKELSASSLQMWINEHDSLCCRKAYEWSLLVNQKIEEMPRERNKAFSEVLETLREISKRADIAVVSSANKQAVQEEWEREGLLPFVNIVMTQEEGSKAACIGKLLRMGYEKERVMMVGDAPGDIKAAKANGVLFYPVFVNQENESWKKLRCLEIEKFFGGVYSEEEEERQIEKFYHNLEKACI